MVERLIDRDVLAALGQRHYQFQFEMDIVGAVRVRELAVGDQIVRVLLEEEGRLAVGIVAHLDRVGGEVTADAIDPVDREKGVGAADRQAGDGCGFEGPAAGV